MYRGRRLAHGKSRLASPPTPAYQPSVARPMNPLLASPCSGLFRRYASPLNSKFILPCSWGNGSALSLLFGLTGFAAYALGRIEVMLYLLDGEHPADRRPHRVSPSPEFTDSGRRGERPSSGSS